MTTAIYHGYPDGAAGTDGGVERGESDRAIQLQHPVIQAGKSGKRGSAEENHLIPSAVRDLLRISKNVE